MSEQAADEQVATSDDVYQAAAMAWENATYLHHSDREREYNARIRAVQSGHRAVVDKARADERSRIVAGLRERAARFGGAPDKVLEDFAAAYELSAGAIERGEIGG